MSKVTLRLDVIDDWPHSKNLFNKQISFQILGASATYIVILIQFDSAPDATAAASNVTQAANFTI